MNGPSARSRVTRKGSKTYCICNKPNDGSPMIHCASCKDWFHFRCVELSEKDAEEIQLYICPPCHQKTGARTIKEWEGPDALKEALGDDTPTRKTTSSPSTKKRASRRRAEKQRDAEESDAPSDESDEYDPAIEAGAKSRGRHHSGDESDSGTSNRAKTPKRNQGGNGPSKEPPPHKQSSPTLNTQQKRKKSVSSQAQPPVKRPRSESTAGDDATRKYCLGKLQELFRQIFIQNPYLQPPPDSDGDGELRPVPDPSKLTPEEKEQLEARAKQFGSDLEQCIYELYSEHDKQGKQVAAGKYKERFRMLTFNLSKSDRKALHERIASSRITPKELSMMSSTDLASEQEKEEIKKLEEEALAHSILKTTVVPRAKLTHKGLQDIEDVTGAGQREAEREREEEEEERIERERLARLRQQAQRAQSQGSAPPESPVVAQNPTWGGPPPVPLHASAASAADPSSSPAASASMGRPPAHPLFVPSASDFAAPVPLENELNLADLINIDEEPSGEVAMTPVDTVPTPFGEVPPLLTESRSEQTNQSTPSPVTPSPTGISPFAAKGSQPDLASRPSFDLNALWTPSSSDVPMEPEAHPESRDTSDAMVTDPSGDAELAPETEDQDFDMFLNANDNEAEGESKPSEPTPAETHAEPKQTAFEDHPTVWTGTVSMPLDSAIPQEVAVVARQTGGRTLGNDSPLWQTLFPSKELRIDGRVPVEKSAQYLTQVRLNPTKELIAVAFSPAAGSDPSGFHAVKSHLVSKGRHGLIFPWGHNPKSSSPGRELYVVPLLSSDPIPEYMELLDQLQLPQSRSVDYLVGIWVLTKGKLAPPPASAAPPVPITAPAAAPVSAPAPLAAAPTPTGMPNIDFAQLQQLGLVQPPQPAQPPPSQPFAIATPPTAPQPTTTAPTSNPSLAADVAQLTPEQIQLMLQTLAKTSQAAPGHIPAGPPPQPYGIPTSMPTHSMPPSQAPVPPQPIALPQAALQAWTGPPAPAYHAPYQQHQPAPPPPYAGGQPSNGTPPYGDRYERDRPYHSPHDYDRGFRGRGGRGRGGNDRGRGRDGSWPKARGRGGSAPRNRGRGGGGGWGGDGQR
ncbi:hypothetical protein OH77DRAFT_1412629 [Trametes cingulata]|nr:hypothetical protein OH77DRAFT_1412629 [Trametes cingulata]